MKRTLRPLLALLLGFGCLSLPDFFIPALAGATGGVSNTGQPSNPVQEPLTGTNFVAVVKAVGGATKTLRVLTPQTISTSVTVPANVCVDVEAEGSFTVAAGQTLTLNCFMAPPRQVFSGAGSVAFTSTAAVGPAGALNAAWWPGNFGQRVAAALASEPSAGGLPVDAQALRGAQSLTSTLTLNKRNVRLLLGDMTLAMGPNQIVVPAGTNGVEVAGVLPWGGLPINGSTLTGTCLLYSGAAAAVLVGDTSSHTENFSLRDVAVLVDKSGTNVVGVHLRGTVTARLDRVRALNNTIPFPNNTGTGILLTGGGNDSSYSADNVLFHPVVDNFKRGIVVTSTVSNVNNNDNQIIGGRVGGAVAGGTAESYGIDIQAGVSNTVRDTYVVNVNRGLRINGLNNYASNVTFEYGGTTGTSLPGYAVEFTSNSRSNFVDFNIVNPGGGNGFITDAGGMNTWNWRSYGPAMQSGLVPPRMTTAERDASVNNAPGTIIWNVTTGKLQVRTGGGWVDLH